MSKDPLLVADGFDHAILGLLSIDGTEVVAYSTRKIIEGLVVDGMETWEAEEYFSFNIEGSYVGPRTPVFIDDTRNDMILNGEIE